MLLIVVIQVRTLSPHSFAIVDLRVARQDYSTQSHTIACALANVHDMKVGATRRKIQLSVVLLQYAHESAETPLFIQLFEVVRFRVPPGGSPSSPSAVPQVSVSVFTLQNSVCFCSVLHLRLTTRSHSQSSEHTTRPGRNTFTVTLTTPRPWAAHPRRNTSCAAHSGWY